MLVLHVSPFLVGPFLLLVHASPFWNPYSEQQSNGFRLCRVERHCGQWKVVVPFCPDGSFYFSLVLISPQRMAAPNAPTFWVLNKMYVQNALTFWEFKNKKVVLLWWYEHHRIARMFPMPPLEISERLILLQREILEARFWTLDHTFSFHFSERPVNNSNVRPKFRTFGPFLDFLLQCSFFPEIPVAHVLQFSN